MIYYVESIMFKSFLKQNIGYRLDKNMNQKIVRARPPRPIRGRA